MWMPRKLLYKPSSFNCVFGACCTRLLETIYGRSLRWKRAGKTFRCVNNWINLASRYSLTSFSSNKNEKSSLRIHVSVAINQSVCLFYKWYCHGTFITKDIAGCLDPRWCCTLLFDCDHGSIWLRHTYARSCYLPSLAENRAPLTSEVCLFSGNCDITTSQVISLQF